MKAALILTGLLTAVASIPAGAQAKSSTMNRAALGIELRATGTRRGHA